MLNGRKNRKISNHLPHKPNNNEPRKQEEYIYMAAPDEPSVFLYAEDWDYQILSVPTKHVQAVKDYVLGLEKGYQLASTTVLSKAEVETVLEANGKTLREGLWKEVKAGRTMDLIESLDKTSWAIAALPQHEKEVMRMASQSMKELSREIEELRRRHAKGIAAMYAQVESERRKELLRIHNNYVVYYRRFGINLESRIWFMLDEELNEVV